MPVDNFTPGRWIRYARSIRPCSQTDVAVHLDVSQGVISQWERDLKVPQETQLRAMEEFLGEAAPEYVRRALSIRRRLSDFLVEPRESMSQRVRELVMNEYEAAVECIGETEIAYVDDKCQSKLSSISSSRISWVRDLAELGEMLFVLYSDCRDKKINLPDDVFRRIIAALCYLVKHDDVIPDTILGDGYLDDALVINECIRHFATACPQYAAEYLPLAHTERQKRGP